MLKGFLASIVVASIVIFSGCGRIRGVGIPATKILHSCSGLNSSGKTPQVVSGVAPVSCSS